MNQRVLLVFCLSVFSISVFFQNCSQSLSGSGSAEFSYAPEENQNEQVSFKAGDTFDPLLVPYVIASEDLKNQLDTYLSWPGTYKSIALTDDGFGLALGTSNGLVRDQADWDKAILERCHLQNRKPCSLLASGDLFAQDLSDFLVNHITTIQTPATFDALLVPAEITHWREQQASTYLPIPMDRFKTYSVSPNGGTATGHSSVSQDEATRKSLEFCEALGDLPCTIYAIGENVVFDIDTFQWEAPSISYGPALFDPQRVPFVNDAVRDGPMQAARDAINRDTSVVIALGKRGENSIRYVAGPITNNDRQAAIDDCNTRLPVVTNGAFQHTCFIYAENLNVVMTRASFELATWGN